MKKLLALCAMTILFAQCSSDDSQTTNDDEGADQLVQFSLTITGDFFVPNSSGKLFLSDEDGTILAEAPTLNNEQTILTADFDPGMTYDLSFYYETFTSGTQFHFVNTFVNVSPGNYSMDPPQGFNGDQDEITLTLTNTGDNLVVVSSSSGIVNTESNSNDGGTFILNGPLPASPGYFYASFLGPNDNLPRYSWSEGTGGSYQINADYSALPFTNDALSITLPTNETSDLVIRGVKDGDPTGVNAITHIVHDESFEDGTTNYQAFLPDGVFENFRVRSSYTLPGTERNYYYTTLSENVPQTLPAVSIDYTVNNDSFANFSIATTGEFDNYDATFIYTNQAQDLVVFYDVFGAASSEVSFSKVNLFNNIFANEPDLSAGLMPPVHRITLSSYSQISSYEEYLQAPWLHGPVLEVGETMERVFE